jgi:hypothetical protein
MSTEDQIYHMTTEEATRECALQLRRITAALTRDRDALIEALDRRLEETLRLFAEKNSKQRALNEALQHWLWPTLFGSGTAAVALRDAFNEVLR